MSSNKHLRFKLFLVAAVASLGLTALTPPAQAQISIRIGPHPRGGPAPACPYGYYDYAPYACAPYGYYGPDWFINGVFIGAGPWYHGPRNFHGRVDDRFDPHHGYHGHFPGRGERRTHDLHDMHGFHGNDRRDGRGH